MKIVTYVMLCIVSSLLLLGLSSAYTIDFSHCGNGLVGDQPCRWEYSQTLNNQRAQYAEDMSIPFRMILTGIDTASGERVQTGFRHKALHSGSHGFDFVTAWNQGNNALMDLDPDYYFNACAGISEMSTQQCQDIREGPYVVDVPLPDDDVYYYRDFQYTQSRIDAFENTYGPRYLTLRGNALISDVQISLDNEAPFGEAGNNHVRYTISWESTASIVFIEFGGHLAVSAYDDTGWSDGTQLLGAATISGSPFAFRINDALVGSEFPRGIHPGAIDPLDPPDVDPEDPWVCEVELHPDGKIASLPVIIRDFSSAHPDFENNVFMDDDSVVLDTLGADGLPVFGGGSPTTTTAENFNQWFRHVSGTNIRIEQTLNYNGGRDETFYYWREEYFPIDGQGFGNEGFARNYHFTTESRLFFEYTGNEEIFVITDDDMFVFVNGRLAINLGGVADRTREQRFILDNNQNDFGLVLGEQYEVAVFSAERNTDRSHFKLQLENFNILENVCELPPPEPEPLLPIPIAACGAQGTLFAYESDTIFTSERATFSPTQSEILTFSRLSSGPSLQTDAGDDVSTSLAHSESPIFVHQATVSSGQELIVQDIPNPNYLIDYQGFVSQSSVNPVINQTNLLRVTNEPAQYRVYLTAQTYRIPLFDKYSETTDGALDTREVSIRIAMEEGPQVDSLVTATPVPTGVQGVVLFEFTIDEDGYYIVTIDTEDPVYHFGFGCEAPPRPVPECVATPPRNLLTPYDRVEFPINEVFDLKGESLQDFTIQTSEPWLGVDRTTEMVYAQADVSGPQSPTISLTHEGETTTCTVEFFGLDTACQSDACAECSDFSCFELNGCIADNPLTVTNPYVVMTTSRFVQLDNSLYEVFMFSVPGFDISPTGGNSFRVTPDGVAPEESVVGQFYVEVNGYEGLTRVCPLFTYRAFDLTPGIGDQDADLLVTGSRAVNHYFELAGEIFTVGPFIFTAKVWVR